MHVVQFDRYISPDGEYENMIEEPVDGYGFEAKQVEDLDWLYKYFTNNGRELDHYNVADGSVWGREWYQKGGLVCHIYSELSGGEEAFEAMLDNNDDDTIVYTSDVEVKCGDIARG